ncbi:peptidyl-trna hydrolase 2 [Seiridium cupressi]
MSELPNSFTPTAMVVSTSIVAFLTGFMLGIYSIRGSFISPALSEERRRNISDPIESDESEVDEDDTPLDHAPNWANSAEADTRDGLKQRNTRKTRATPAEGKLVDVDTPALAQGKPNEECKLVLVVRTDLGMTKVSSTGKIAAQCSHATLACYKTLSRKAPTSPESQLLKRWERQGQAKIAVQIKSQQELLDLMGKARSLGLTAEVIQDAGRTQIEAGSMTVLGVGPAPKSLVDQVTGGLKLL